MIEQINKILRDFDSEESVLMKLVEKLKKYFSVNHVIPVTNGTHAIEIALKAAMIPVGSSVIIPDISFIATATAVANCGLIPIYSDVDKDFFGITLEQIKRKFNKNVKAVIAVHFSGFMNREIEKIADYCRENSIVLIEDCAQAFSSTLNNRRAGTFGDFGTFSFQSSKIISSGEGGLIITSNEKYSNYCEVVRNWGVMNKKYDRDLNFASGNYRLGSIQAYFLLKQLDFLKKTVAKQLNKVDELANGFKKIGMEPMLPEKAEVTFDCPFFFPVKSLKRINTIEPRSEYPMRRSQIVRSILSTYFPNLLEEYDRVNACEFNALNSWNILDTIDFILIKNILDKPVKDILEPYLKSI
jgi:dTDP-4-amino-4,6-dideoxygalactose transaminase